jgi:hypothetical protein
MGLGGGRSSRAAAVPAPATPTPVYRVTRPDLMRCHPCTFPLQVKAQWARALASGPLRSCPGIGVSAGSRAVDDGEMADAGAPWPRRCACRSRLTPAGSSGRPPRRRIHVTTTWRWTSGWVPAPTSWILAAGVGSGRSRRAGLTVRNELGSSWRSWPVQQQTRRTQQQDPADQPARLRPPQPRRRHRHDLPLLQRTDHHAAPGR